MKSLGRLLAVVLLTGPVVFTVQAAFSSFYIFGDGACSTTTTSNQPTAYYYGNRYCNGRVWVEVLAQRQGVTFDSAKNNSYFGHTSTNLLASISQFSAPADASNSLFVVWVCDADFVRDMNIGSTNLAIWNSYLSNSLANHLQAISNLYAKGARTLLMPNAVNIADIPKYSGSAPENKEFVRQRVIDFNADLATRLSQARVSLPGISIYAPDFFGLLTNMMAKPADYGVTNALYNGHTIGAIGDPAMTDYALNGPGSYYIFWDPFDPTARAHAVMADIAQQLISPASITNLALLQGSNQLDAVHLPIGLSGFVDGRTNLVAGNWLTNLSTSFNSTNATQSILVPGSNPGPFYRLRFPFAWSWP